MVKHLYKSIPSILAAAGLLMGLAACSNDQTGSKKNSTPVVAAESKAAKEVLKNNIKLSSIRGTVRDKVNFTVNELEPNVDVQLLWKTADGKYKLDGIYSVIGPEFKEKEIVLAKGKSDANGVWEGSFKVPEGFGGDTTIYVQNGKTKIGQIGFTVDPTFTMTPESGPVGTEITVKVEGLGWTTYARNWQLTYDNKYTGLVTAISTNGASEAKLRAAGPAGKHAIRLRTGYLGMPYINYLQSPFPDKPAPEFMFEVTDNKTVTDNYVEPAPKAAASGGVELPELKNRSGINVSLNKTEGAVGQPVLLTAEGLEKNQEVEFVWNTMKGSRVSGQGFADQSSTLGKAKTDGTGKLSYDFNIPADLGGIPHRIDIKADGKVVGQQYLRILPSIVSISPKSGPVGTKIQITINGGGWTEFDNAYYLTYDNAYAGYLCAFNSQGNLTFDVVATGETGFHIIDLYPGIYKQEQKDTDMTLIPQLTYTTDHPGSAMPAIRLGFEVTE